MFRLFPPFVPTGTPPFSHPLQMLQARLELAHRGREHFILTGTVPIASLGMSDPVREAARGNTGVLEDTIHIGQILIEQGTLSQQQVLEILHRQRVDGIPFGVLAEHMFDVTLASIEKAWADQYHRLTGTIDLAESSIDPQVLGLIDRRQAWQFEMMPLHYGEQDRELVMAATGRRLARAVTFAVNRLKPIVYFRVAQESQLRQMLQRYYPMPEIPQEMINRAKHLA